MRVGKFITVERRSSMAISVAQQVYHHSLRKDDKGSMVNKTKCAASHFKNDLKYALLGSTVAAAGIGAGCLVYKKPKIGINAMKTAGDMVAGLGKALGKFKTKFVADFGAALGKHGTTIAGKAAKYGKFGTIAAVAIGTLGALTGLATKHAYNEGRIEQKYVDNAKIEKMTGSIVV